MTTDNPKLLVGRYLADTISMGPGLRAVVWVAGCSINCKGCATPKLIGKERGVWRTVEEVGEWLARDKAAHGIEGVSFSGGEPFEQASGLADVARIARGLGLSTLSWSGYTRAQLEGPKAPPGAAALLAELDVLIDGPFMLKKMAGDTYRGSSNQVIHYLTDRYGPADFAEAHLDVRLPESPGDPLVISGVADTVPLRAALQLLGLAADDDADDED